MSNDITDKQNKYNFEQYKLAAEKGDVQAMFEMYCCFYYGKGVNQDLTYATTWLNKAAANGYPKAIEAMEYYNKNPMEREKYTFFGVKFFTDSVEKYRNRQVVMTGCMLYEMGFNHFEKSDKYYEIHELSDGMHVVGFQSSYYPPDEDGFGEECNFTYGYYNKNFCPVISFRYDKASPFHNGIAKVADSTGIYQINKKGEKI